MGSKLKENQKGFTIIEVLIVLAIAGLIMVIVFLAVPSLQRSSRNTQRNADASKLASGISDCMAQKNGQVTSCDSTAELVALGLDVTKMQQITPQANIVVTGGAPADPGNGNINHANAGFGRKCNAAGDGLDAAAGSTRQAAVLYRIEVQGNGNGTLRCLDV